MKSQSIFAVSLHVSMMQLREPCPSEDTGVVTNHRHIFKGADMKYMTERKKEELKGTVQLLIRQN